MTNCKICDSTAKLTVDHFCQACVKLDAAGIEAAIKARKKRAANAVTTAKLHLRAVHVPRESPLDAAIAARLAKTGETFSALALHALARFLRTENPKPERGRKELQAVEW